MQVGDLVKWERQLVLMEHPSVNYGIVVEVQHDAFHLNKFVGVMFNGDDVGDTVWLDPGGPGKLEVISESR